MRGGWRDNNINLEKYYEMLVERLQLLHSWDGLIFQGTFASTAVDSEVGVVASVVVVAVVFAVAVAVVFLFRASHPYENNRRAQTKTSPTQY